LTIRLNIGGPDEEEIVRLMDQALETDGIPATLLRQIPLAEIKVGPARRSPGRKTGR
jgi:hypothetical protein